MPLEPAISRYAKAALAIVGLAAFLLAVAWTLLVLWFTNVPMTIGGSGLSRDVMRTLEIGFWTSALINGFMMLTVVKYRWLVVAVLLQYVFTKMVLGRLPDWHTLYFVAVLSGGLSLIFFARRRITLALRR